MTKGVVAEIKSINYHWWNREPEPADGATSFAGTAQILIGEVGEDPADSFDVIVCSADRLAAYLEPENWEEDDTLPGGNIRAVTGTWLMKVWSQSEFEGAVQRVVLAYSPGPNFATVAARIGRVLPWEYDYRYDNAVNEAARLPPLTRSFWHD